MTDEQIAERLLDKSTWENGWQTRDGHKVRILAVNAKGGDEPIVALIEEFAGSSEQMFRYHPNGRYCSLEHCYDLIPRSVKRQGWVAIYWRGATREYTTSVVYATEADIRRAEPSATAYAPIEWEESC